MASSTEHISPEQLDVVLDGVKIVSLCSDITLFTTRDVSDIAQGVLNVYESFLLLVGPNSLKWYSTENMNRHKPVNPRVIDMLRGWLRPGAPKRPTIHIHLKDGDQYADAASCSFWIWGNEQGEARHGIDANVIRCTFGSDWALNNSARLMSFARDMSDQIPFDSGLGGLCLETTQYKQEASETAAWKLSIQHPGLDISNALTDSVALQKEGVKGVNWLTMLGDAMLDQLGGAESLRARLPESVRLERVNHGIVLVAGDKPAIGYVNREELLPAYRAVYRVVEPLQRRIADRYSAFDLPGGDHKEKTRRWLRRFADG